MGHDKTFTKAIPPEIHDVRDWEEYNGSDLLSFGEGLRIYQTDKESVSIQLRAYCGISGSRGGGKRRHMLATLSYIPAEMLQGIIDHLTEIKATIEREK